MSVLLPILLSLSIFTVAGQTEFRTVASAAGYSISVPLTWQPASPASRDSDIDLQYESPDGSQLVTVFVDILATGDSGDAVQLLGNFLDDLSPAAYHNLNADAPGPASRVPGASSAAAATFTYTDAQGISYVDATLLAVRGRTAYLFVVDLPTAWVNANLDSSQRLIGSFRLTP